MIQKLKYSVIDFVKDYSILTIGILLYVGAWCLFLVPNELVGGGVSGLSSIIYYATGIPISYSFFVLNAILLIIAVIVIGPHFGVKTVYAIIIASIGFKLLPYAIPQEVIQELAIKNGKLMSTIFGGIIAGTGIGISLSVGGSTGGTDIVAMIVNKYKNVSPGKIILLSDILIILSSMLMPNPAGGYVAFADKVTTVIYGLIVVAINSTAIDFYLSGSKQSVQLFIMSSKYEEIADTITSVFGRGVTVINATGWFTKNENKVLMVVSRKSDLNLMLRYIKMIDSDAFISVSSVSGVYGKGFDVFKGKEVKKNKK